MANVGEGPQGYVYTSNGPGAAPSFQPMSGSFMPNATVLLYDDFITTVQAGTTLNSILSWIVSPNLGFTQSNATSGNPGVITFAGSNGGALYSDSNNGSGIAGAVILGGGILTTNWVIKTSILSNGTNRYTLYIGLGDTTNGSDQANGVYFTYSDNLNSGNWVAKTASGSTRTSANSAIAATASDFVNLGIVVNASASSVAYYINGIQIANSPITTNIPTAAIAPFMSISQVSGTLGQCFQADLFYMTQVLTTAR